MCTCHRNVVREIFNPKGEKDGHEEWCVEALGDILARPEVYWRYPKDYNILMIEIVESKRKKKLL